MTPMETLKNILHLKLKTRFKSAYRAFANQLGLSPAATAQLAGMQLQAKEEEEDPVLKLLSGN